MAKTLRNQLLERSNGNSSTSFRGLRCDPIKHQEEARDSLKAGIYLSDIHLLIKTDQIVINGRGRVGGCGGTTITLTKVCHSQSGIHRINEMRTTL